MIDADLKTLLEKQFGKIDDQFGKIDEQFDLVLRTTKEGFDATASKVELHQFRQAVDARFKTLEADIADIKHRMSGAEQELVTLSASMVTKQYLDAKIDALLLQPPVSKIEGMRKAMLAMMLILERNKLLPSEQRAMFEMMIG